MTDYSISAKVTADTGDFDSKMSGASTTVDGFKKKLGESTGGTDQFKSSMADVATAANTAGIGLTANVTQPLVNVGKSAIDASASFETSMNTIQAMTGASGDEMQALSDKAKQVGQDTIFSSGEAADAMLELSKAGMSNSQIMGGALDATMQLATIGDMGLADASATTANVMNMFGLSAEDSSQAVVALAGVANASTADVDDLAQGLSQCGTVAANAGWSLQDTTATLGAFASAGINGSDAGTSLKTMLMALEAPSSKAKSLMDQYGISLYNADGSMKSADEVAGNLQGSLGGLSDEQKNAALATIFGSDATRAATVMMNEGADGINGYKDAANDSATAQDMMTAKTEGTAGALEQAKGSIDNAKIALGDALAPIIQQVAGFVEDLANKFSSLPAPVQGIIAVVGILAAVMGPLMTIFGGVLTAIVQFGPAMAALKGAFSLVSGGASALFSVLAANPIILVVAAIAALVAGLIWFFTQTETGRQIWSNFMSALQAGWDAFVAGFQAGVAAVQSAFAAVGAFLTSVKDGIQAGWQGLQDWFANFPTNISNFFTGLPAMIGGFFDQAKDWASNTWQGAQDWFAGVPGNISNFFSGLPGPIGDFFGQASDFAKNHGDEMQAFYSGLPGNISNFFSSIPNWIGDKFNQAKDWANNAGQGMVDFFSGIPDRIAGFFSGIGDKISSFFRGIKLPHFSPTMTNIAGIDVPTGFDVSWYAKGGIFETPSVIGVGEAGPEAVIPIGQLSKYMPDPENQDTSSSTVNQYFNTRVVRDNDDLYVASTILHRSALAAAR